MFNAHVTNTRSTWSNLLYQQVRQLFVHFNGRNLCLYHTHPPSDGAWSTRLLMLHILYLSKRTRYVCTWKRSLPWKRSFESRSILGAWASTEGLNLFMYSSSNTSKTLVDILSWRWVPVFAFAQTSSLETPRPLVSCGGRRNRTVAFSSFRYLPSPSSPSCGKKSRVNVRDRDNANKSGSYRPENVGHQSVDTLTANKKEVAPDHSLGLH